MVLNRRLVIDVGMSEGNDTEFYLRKGFDVVGVEADPALHAGLETRFADAIAAGRLRIVKRAAARTAGSSVAFWHDTREQGHSSLDRRERTAEDAEAFQVTTIDWAGLCAVAGVPYYLKIDIEGGEPAFLEGMVGTPEPPPYISAEVQTFAPIELFRRIGYTQFRLINQNIWHVVAPPQPPREGAYVPDPERSNWSGLFGRELPGSRWFSFDEIKEIHATIHRLWTYETLITGWMDCHAHRPEVTEAP